MIERIPNPFFPFSDAVIVTGPGHWVHVSGQVGFDDSGKPQVSEADFAREADLCFRRLREALERAGATMSEVVRINAYLTDLSLYGDYSEARNRAFGSELPSSAAVQVAGLLAGARVEVDAVAYVADGA
jgi:2-iminobutanoate/2-iminopropanoate deaminase